MSGQARVRLRLLKFQLAHALGLGDRGWFIPYRYKAASPPPTAPYPEGAFRAAEPAMLEALEAIARFEDVWPTFAGRPEPPTPRFDQDWFPGLDAALLYALTRTRRPSRIVEVGSGHSTRFAARAIADEGLATVIDAIDPAPRADILGLAPTVRLHQTTAQSAPSTLFEALAPGDFLFIDSSHVLMPGSDVDILFNRILPTLPAGVFVHIHDIFLPDPYPADWEWRGYNEQNAAATLIAGGGYRIVAASGYMATRMPATDPVVAMLPPSPEGARPASLWLEKRAGPCSS